MFDPEESGIIPLEVADLVSSKDLCSVPTDVLSLDWVSLDVLRTLLEFFSWLAPRLRE